MVTCEQALRGALAAGREKEGELGTTSLELEFYLQFAGGSPSTNECDCKQTLKKHVPTVMTSLLMSSPPISISHRLISFLET